MGPSQRMVGLDGLRALAIGLVLVDHLWSGHFDGGGIGVVIFFVLSGYLITSLLTREKAREGRIGLGAFYLRRALRLWPALIAMLLGTIALGASARSALVAGTYLTDLANISGRLVLPYGHTWSLAVEEQFYLVWPLCLLAILALPARSRNGVLLAGILLSIAGCATWTILSLRNTGTIGLGIFSPLWQGHGLLLGCLLALVGQSWHVRRPGVVVLGASAIQLVIAVVASVLVARHLALLWNVAAELVAMLMIVCLRSLETGPYTWRPVVWMGQRSYAIYLWHLPLIILFGLHGWWHAAVLGVAASFVLAEISGRFVEAPFLRLKDRLPRSRRAVAAVT